MAGKKPKRATWISLAGDIRSTANGFVYHPIPPIPGLPTTDKESRSSYALAKTDISFSSGSVEFAVKLGSKDDRVQLLLNHGLANPIMIGLNPPAAAAAYGISAWRGTQYEPLSNTGTPGTLDAKHSYSLRIEVAGSTIKLFVDGVEAVTAIHYVLNAQLAVFVSGEKPIEITNFKVDNLRPRIFVVMQFTPEFDALYAEVIKPVSEEYGYECVRGDDVYNNGLIIEDISRSIRESSIIIADITPDNPNVFYEVGYSHGLNKPTILLSDRKRERLPFDVSGFRTLFYDNTIGGKSSVEERLRNHFDNLKV